jgi:hypothetical protein
MIETLACFEDLDDLDMKLMDQDCIILAPVLPSSITRRLFGLFCRVSDTGRLGSYAILGNRVGAMAGAALIPIYPEL